jgi:DNA-binding transcriptional regulator GbsR (MarR family)
VSRKSIAVPPAEDSAVFDHAGPALCAEGGGMSGFEREIVGVFVGLAQGVGLPKSYGEIYGLLFSSAQPLDFAAIQGRLELSKGSVSQGLRALREIGAVSVAEHPGARRELYVATIELRQLMGALLRGTLQPQLARGAGQLAMAARLLRRERRSAAEERILAVRVRRLQNWHRKAGGLLPWIAKFLG